MFNIKQQLENEKIFRKIIRKVHNCETLFIRALHAALSHRMRERKSVLFSRCYWQKMESWRRWIGPRANRDREQFDMIESYITHDIHNAFKRHRIKTALVKVAC